MTDTIASASADTGSASSVLSHLADACSSHDYSEAFRIAHPLALNGEPKAQAVLGGLHFGGVGGCSPDLVEAWAWLHRAECGGYAEAREMLELAEERLSVDELAVAARRSLSILLDVQRRALGAGV